MGLGQMLMALFATILLSTLILSINRTSLEFETNIAEYKVKSMAMTLGRSVIDEAQTKRFDERSSLYSVVIDSTNFTSNDDLGAETGETDYNDYDDFDDYDDYFRRDTVQLYIEAGRTIPRAEFTIEANVKYVDFSNLDTPISDQRFYKRIEVLVYSTDRALMPDTVRLYSICGYWPFF